MNIKTYIKEIVLAVYLLLSLRILLRTPIEKVVLGLEAGFEVLLVLGLGIFLVQKAFSKTISRFESYLLVLCVVPFAGAFTAAYFYSQPLWYGLLAQRDFFLCLSALFLFNALKKGWITIDNLKRVLIGLSWFCLLSYILVNLTVNPVPFKTTGFVGYNPLKGGYLFRFNMTLIIFGTFYYFTSLLKNLNKVHAIYFMLFFGYLALIRQDRTIVLTTIVGLAILIAKNITFKRGFYTVAVMTAIGIIFLSGTYFFSNDFIPKMNQLYTNSIEVVMNLGAEEQIKGNGSIRISEAQIAADGFLASPIFGQGTLSKRFNGGFNAIYGHFYPADVGILGVLFLYGILGVLLVFYQVVLLLRYRTALKTEHVVFLTACMFFLIQFLLNSLTDGRVVLRSAVSLTFLVPIYFIFYRSKQELNEAL